MNPGSVSRLLPGIAAADSQAHSELLKRYWDSLLSVARRRLAASPSRALDEEDVALSVFWSFFRGVPAGRFPQLEDRTDLWRVLVTLAIRKSLTQVRAETAQKRGGGGSEAPIRLSLDDPLIQEALSQEPTTEMVVMTAELCEHLLASLPDDSLRTFARQKLEGYSAREIAQHHGFTVRTIERKLERIRAHWSAYERHSEK